MLSKKGIGNRDGSKIVKMNRSAANIRGVSKILKIQGVLALCEFHYCEFGYCGFSKLLLKICLMRFLCTITLVNADISYRYMPNAIFG